jgi:WD40-like Beta Propeller Repeat
MRSRPSLSLASYAAGLVAVGLLSGFGCAGVKPHAGGTGGTNGGTGSGGTGNVYMPPMPSIQGLTGLSISGTTTVSLTAGSTPGTLTGMATYTATGTFMDGSSKDVSSMVNWGANPATGITVLGGNGTITAPGTYQISATSGTVSSNQVTLVATFSGNFTCTDFGGSGCGSADMAKLDGSPSGSTTITYPLDSALFPENLGPIQVHIATAGTSARINFKTANTGNVNVNYYGACETGGANLNSAGACYVTIPLALTQLFVPSCETDDIQITARVSKSGGAPVESKPVTVDWAQSGLTGGLYYWTVLPNQKPCPTATAANPPNYCLQDITQNPPNGTAIYRYDFSKDNPMPQLVWTDDGGPNSMPAYQGGPQAWNGGVAGGHCIGCHTITNDGKYMALTIGGSSTYNAANWELLDIGNQALLLDNPTATGGSGCNDPNASPTSDSTCYWQQYRKDGFATETAWGPNGDLMVSMFKAKLFTNGVATSGTSATLSPMGLTFPTSSPDKYQSDPFWSHDGAYLAFTSFATAATADSTGNPAGENGDLKKGGQIALATATPTGVMDNAKVLVKRASNTTFYYPCISEDSKYVVFNQSTCGTDPDVNYNGSAGYGTGTCDGYDDSSAKLEWVPIDGGQPKELTAANGGSMNYDNSWPRFSPDVGIFRGATLYWVAFSSRRPYGSQLNTSGLMTSQPQLWFTGVVATENVVGDPSRAPVWLPGQNAMQSTGMVVGNHVPQWVKVAIVIDKGSL